MREREKEREDGGGGKMGMDEEIGESKWGWIEKEKAQHQEVEEDAW